MITLAEVCAFLREDVELLDARVRDGIVVRVGMCVDRAADRLLRVGRGADDPVLDLGDPSAMPGPTGLGSVDTPSPPVAILMAPALIPVWRAWKIMPSVRSVTKNSVSSSTVCRRQ